MKKLYLIDDNLDGNRLKYGGGFVDDGKYPDVLCTISKLSKDSNLDFIKEAECVMMHETLCDYYDGEYHDESHAAANRIKLFPEIYNEQIPFVVYSDGIKTGNTFGKELYNGRITKVSLNKRTFYSRLEPFVANYVNNKTIDLRILVYGKHFETILIDKAATAMFSKLQEFKDTDYLDAGVLNCDEMRQIVEFSQPVLGKNFTTIIADLLKNPITVGEYKNKINNILDSFNDYGKNTYTWQ